MHITKKQWSQRDAADSQGYLKTYLNVGGFVVLIVKWMLHSKMKGTVSAVFVLLYSHLFVLTLHFI